MQQLKTDSIERQGRVIGLQEDIIATKNEQLFELKDTLLSSVALVRDTIETQLKSYSEADQEKGNLVGASSLIRPLSERQ